MSKSGAILLIAAALAITGTAARGGSSTERPDPQGLTGQLLVATEDIRDPRFHETVILMIRHDATGAMGLVVNRPLGEAPLAPLLKRLDRDSDGVSGTIRVHYGGPVGLGWGFVVHTIDWVTRGSRIVLDGVAVTTDPAILDAIARDKGPKRFLFALGYAGWAPGQLETEIEHGAWVSVPADESLIFDKEAAGKWERAMALRRIVL
jgi:putative transcriptional regulator